MFCSSSLSRLVSLFVFCKRNANQFLHPAAVLRLSRDLGLPVVEVKIEEILRLILAAGGGVSLLVGVAGYRIRAGGGRKLLIAAVLVWCIGSVLGVLALRNRVGPIIVEEGALLAAAPGVALAGGLLAHGRREKNIGAFIALAACALACADLGAFYSLNHAVVEIASSIGLTGTRTKKVEPTENKECPENLKSLYLAFSLYVESNGSLPPADKWMDNQELTSRIQKDEWLHCPEVSNRKDTKFGYAYNDAVAAKSLDGKKLAEMPDAARTPLLYDSDNLAKSAHDAFRSLPANGRHAGKNNVLYCDGHINAVRP